MSDRLVLAVATLAPALALAAPAGPAGAHAPGVATDGAGPADRHITMTRYDHRREFRHGDADGVRPGRHGGIALRRHTGNTTTYDDPFDDAGPRTYESGSWTSPVTALDYGATEAIASWNARTPTGTFVRTTFRGRHADGTWTKWYVLGRWTSGDDFEGGDIHRTSLNGQGDTDGTVYTDTFSAADGREVTAFQSRVTLLRREHSHVTPSLSAIGTMTSAVPDGHPQPTSTFTLGRHVELGVPRFSQNIHAGEYPEFGGGGEVWCSPTSTTMAQYFFGRRHSVPRRELAGIDAPNGDPQVDYAAMHTWDYTYDGAGNWPFNAAYAARFGLETQVTRLRSLAEAERFIAAGIPVVTSLSWDLEEMPEAGYETDGHLMVIVGFTADGDPILNDPASSSDEAVRNVYTREHFEKVWQDSTGGIAYLYHPKRVRLPRNVPGLEHNW